MSLKFMLKDVHHSIYETIENVHWSLSLVPGTGLLKPLQIPK